VSTLLNGDFFIPPPPASVSALAGETWTQEIWSLQSCCILKVTLIWLAISSTFIHQPLLIIFGRK